MSMGGAPKPDPVDVAKPLDVPHELSISKSISEGDSVCEVPTSDAAQGSPRHKTGSPQSQAASPESSMNVPVPAARASHRIKPPIEDSLRSQSWQSDFHTAQSDTWLVSKGKGLASPQKSINRPCAPPEIVHQPAHDVFHDTTLSVVQRELTLLTEKVRNDIRQDLDVFLRAYDMPVSARPAAGRPPGCRLMAPVDAEDGIDTSAFDVDASYDDEGDDLMSRPRRGFMASDLWKEDGSKGTEKDALSKLIHGAKNASHNIGLRASRRPSAAQKGGLPSRHGWTTQNAHSTPAIKLPSVHELDAASAQAAPSSNAKAEQIKDLTTSNEDDECEPARCDPSAVARASDENHIIHDSSQEHERMFIPQNMKQDEQRKVNLMKTKSHKNNLGEGCHVRISRVVRSDFFNGMVGILIFVNSLWIGVQTEWDVRAVVYGKDVPSYMRIVSTSFCVLFSAEVILRLYVQRLQFFCGEDCRWNLFDMIIVGFQLVEEVLEHAMRGRVSGFSSSWMRLLRALRLVRIARLVRILHLLHELRTMLSSIVCTMGSLAWTLVLLLLITYAASLGIAQMVADHGLHTPQDVAPGTDLQRYYGSLGSSMLALYSGISGGLDWRDISDPLDSTIGASMSFFFVLFIAFTTLSLLNVVTGIFVESALQNTKEEGDLNMVNRLREVMILAEIPPDGDISWEEFHHQLEFPQMKAYFKSVDLDVSEAKNLFKLLDHTDCGVVHAEDFIMGCLRLRGSAKAIDLATLMSEFRRMHRMWRMQSAQMTQKLLSLESLRKDSSEGAPNDKDIDGKSKLSTSSLSLKDSGTSDPQARILR